MGFDDTSLTHPLVLPACSLIAENVKRYTTILDRNDRSLTIREDVNLDDYDIDLFKVRQGSSVRICVRASICGLFGYGNQMHRHLKVRTLT